MIITRDAGYRLCPRMEEGALTIFPKTKYRTLDQEMSLD